MYYIRNVETLSRVTLPASLSLGDREILTPDAIEFLARIHTAFGDRRAKLLARRSLIQHEIDLGYLPDFSGLTRPVRDDIWRVKSVPADLSDRRVEVVVPARNAVQAIEALNSGANVCVLDFEDSLSPNWSAVIEGQRTIRGAVRRELSSLSPEGRKHTLVPFPATIMVRPRGWHLLEKHFCVDGDPVSASLFDFGLFAFHNARELVGGGSGPYLSIPKIENRFEAALWNEVFRFTEEYLRLPAGAFRASILIETILAAFEMDEILYELRDRAVGLNCDRRDMMFSFIKTFRKHPACLLSGSPEGGIDALTAAGPREILLVQTCHRRGACAIGDISAAIPASNDPAAREAVRDSVRAAKVAEACAGFDGTSVAYPALVRVAREAFESVFLEDNQLGEMRFDASIGRDDLLSIPPGTVSENVLRGSIGVSVRYLESWLSGSGAAALYGRIEDTAGAELARSYAWQWMNHGARLSDGTDLTPARFRKIFSEEMDRIYDTVGPERYRRGQFDLASRLFFNLVHGAEFTPFLTLKAYQYI
jgi:malate synthase